MSYQSILVHACQPATAQARYQLAASIALAAGAQLAGIAASGATEVLYRSGAAAAMMPIGPDDCAFLTENARRDLAAFEDTVRATGAHVGPGRVTDETATAALPLAGRYADLLVIGQACSPDAIIANDQSLARTVLVHAPCPVLVVPADCRSFAVPQRALLAWDGSMEASRAVRGALPLLQRAGSVTVACFFPQKYEADGGAGGAALVAYLACHGVAVDVLAPAHANSVGHALLALAESRGHDLIVMGSFGHSRLREAVLGGATQTVLAEAGIPLLTSH